jgi:aminoglycoside phosphotransferase (APT) family kinase protein
MFTALVAHLAQFEAACPEHEWQDWHISPIASGNNRLFRATRDADDWAVKFMIRDDRDRARREFDALSLMERGAPGLAPRPLYLDLDSYSQSVVVQTWLSGTPLWAAPADSATWLQILQAYRRVHLTPPPDGPIRYPLTPADILASLPKFAGELPEAAQSERLARLLSRLESLKVPKMPDVRCWGHGDTNIRNLILTADGVKLVDWEYSGVTDPAHEIAMLMSHHNAATAGEAHWDWVAEQYAALSGEPDMLPRIQVFYALRLALGCVRLLFGRYVLLEQPSRRLVGHGPEAEMSTLENIDLYFERAFGRLAAFG